MRTWGQLVVTPLLFGGFVLLFLETGCGDKPAQNMAPDSVVPPAISFWKIEHTDKPSLSDIKGFIPSVSPIPDGRSTSSFMIGKVVVNLMLPDSEGTQHGGTVGCFAESGCACDPQSADPSVRAWCRSYDWCIGDGGCGANEVSLVIDQVKASLRWWEELARTHEVSLQFVLHLADDGRGRPPLVATRFEPILYKAFAEYPWLADMLDHLGAATASNTVTRMANYNDALRQRYHADWAITLIVVDRDDNRLKFGPPDGGINAWASVSHAVVSTTRVDGSGKPLAILPALVHEIGHTFGALDQFPPFLCDSRAGYLSVLNENSTACKGSNTLPSIMVGSDRYTHHFIDPWGVGQIGWQDSDDNGIPDPVDVKVRSDVRCEQSDDGSFIVTGAVQVVPVATTSRSYTTVTINRIHKLEYQLKLNEAETGWLVPSHDGALDSYFEGFRLRGRPMTDQLPVLRLRSATQFTPQVTQDYALQTLCTTDS